MKTNIRIILTLFSLIFISKIVVAQETKLFSYKINIIFEKRDSLSLIYNLSDSLPKVVEGRNLIVTEFSVNKCIEAKLSVVYKKKNIFYIEIPPFAFSQSMDINIWITKPKFCFRRKVKVFYYYVETGSWSIGGYGICERFKKH